jgi:hypothetical protein
VSRMTLCGVNMAAKPNSGTDGDGRYNVPFGVNVSNVQYLQVRTSPCTNCGQPSSACSGTNVAWYEVEPYRLGP